MGPVFYLVQSHGVRDPISAVVLGNWPHEFALAPSPGKKGRAHCRRLGLRRLLGGLRREKKASREIRAIWTVRSAARWWIFCEDRFGK